MDINLKEKRILRRTQLQALRHISKKHTRSEDLSRNDKSGIPSKLAVGLTR
jgi:hypothetical protein